MFTLVKLYITFQDDNLQQRLTQWILRMVENAEIGHITQGEYNFLLKISDFTSIIFINKQK